MIKYFKNISNSVLSILEGMAVTLSWMFRRPYTVQWPDKIEKDLEEHAAGAVSRPPRSRNPPLHRVHGVHEGVPDRVIAVTVERNAETKERRITQFDIDASKCMDCGLCVEACPTGGLRHTTQFAAADRRRPQPRAAVRREGLAGRASRAERACARGPAEGKHRLGQNQERLFGALGRQAVGEAMTYAIMFYALCALILVSSATVALSANIIYSAFSLLFAFIGVGLIYAMLSADFLAITQLMLYVGGILVLILFAVMLTYQIEESKRSNQSFSRGLALLMAAGLFCVLAMAVVLAPWKPHAAEPPFGPMTAEHRQQPPGTVSAAF